MSSNLVVSIKGSIAMGEQLRPRQEILINDRLSHARKLFSLLSPLLLRPLTCICTIASSAGNRREPK